MTPTLQVRYARITIQAFWATTLLEVALWGTAVVASDSRFAAYAVTGALAPGRVLPEILPGNGANVHGALMPLGAASSVLIYFTAFSSSSP